MKTVALIQARMSSSRLPGKVLRDIAGLPMLLQVVQRAKQANFIKFVAVVTSTHAADDAIEGFCQEHGIPCFRGSLDDVLDRYYQAASHFQAEAVVRLTGDCPLLDPQIIDKVIQTFYQGGFDYVSNALECTYPDGLDTEIFRFAALERAWKEARLKSEREHVTAYIYKHPALFRLGTVKHEEDLSFLRWTVDTSRDLDFVKTVYSSFPNTDFGMDDILKLLKEHPEITKINSGQQRNEGYLKSLQEDSKFRQIEANRMGAGQQLYIKAKKRIPGGTQLLSKRPEMFLPEQWPSFYSKAKGVDVWDLDGNRFIDMSHNSVGACILGVGDPEVDAAVKNAIEAGTMATLNCPEEVELADLLCELHPWAEMVRYAKGGGEAMAVAVRIARAHTGRDVVAFCGYHGWHDWYLSANLAEESALDGHLLPGLSPAGVPRGLLGTALPFRYNHLEELQEIAAAHPDKLAAVVMEPIRDREPEPAFVDGVREIATKTRAVLIIDEVSAGFRLNTGGAHLLYGFKPDMAVFAKAMSNGYPMAAIIGRRQVMDSAQKTFISSTYWTERIGLAAALATIRKHKANEVASHLNRMGKMVQTGWREAAAASELPIEVGGIYPLSHFAIQNEQSQAAHTLFSQIMLEKGFLASRGFYATYAHREEHLEAYLAAVREAFGMIAAALKSKDLMAKLKGPIAHTGFKRLT